MGDRAARRMTIAEFLSWQADQDARFELVDSEPVAMAGARLRHDRATGHALSSWRNETFHDIDATIGMPGLGFAISLMSLYERVPLTARPRPRLEWDEAGEGGTQSETPPG